MDFAIDSKGKTALVTGSSRGIGREAALMLASLGARVIFHGTKETPQLLSAVAEAGEKAFSLEETLILPPSMPRLEKLLCYQLQPQITEEAITERI